jgi:hypothetical protein
MGRLLVLLAGVVALSGLIGFGGLAGPLTWPVMGVFFLSLLLLFSTALLAAAGFR